MVPRPVPKSQIEDPRSFQITQLSRRFSPIKTEEDHGTALEFRMVPSDPDFPFEMPGGLECGLYVPSDYPRHAAPCLKVRNLEMGIQYRENIEKGFNRIIQRTPQATLLGLMNALDRQLEGLLGGEKEVELTIIPNKNPTKEIQPPRQTTSVKNTNTNSIIPVRTSKPSETHTTEQLSLAKERRTMETRQVEARLGRASLFSRSADGIAYTLPVTPRKHSDLPVPLQAIQSVKLFVPQLYPLQHARIEIQGVSREDAKVTEKAFVRKARDTPDTTLMGHINHLAQNMHVLATETIQEPAIEEENVEGLAPVEAGESAISSKLDEDEDRDNIVFVPRPPEWSIRNDEDDSSESEYSDSYDSGDEDEAEGGITLDAVPETQSTSAPERGISLSFPSLELYGIELLEMVSLCITVKCERCKDTMDINNLRDKSQKVESCKKCAMSLSIGFRRELMHASSVRAGYLDLEGCTVTDMLPSNFVPTCSECSTSHPPPGLVSVRGESTMAICRNCHRKMSFKIPEIRFLLVSSAARSDRAPVRRRPKEALGIVAGQGLPRRGCCSHYAKSYRWFRFSCCSKVFPCDRCHDEASDHPNEHANRMICGYCSREQNYRPEDCGMCHSSLVKKAGSGFWEGGKGTRDKNRMSRKGM